MGRYKTPTLSAVSTTGQLPRNQSNVRRVWGQGGRWPNQQSAVLWPHINQYGISRMGNTADGSGTAARMSVKCRWTRATYRSLKAGCVPGQRRRRCPARSRL